MTDKIRVFSLLGFTKFIFYKSTLVPFILFIFISTIYFASSVGLMNSLDAPQYFTTEAILYYGNLDLAPFGSDPHYWVEPDIYYYKNQVLGVRGFLLNLLVLPMHTYGYIIKQFFRIDNFPSSANISPYFRYELAITSLFTLISSLGLVVFWQLEKEITKSNWIATVTTIILALGSYIWKYSASYTRHGYEVLLLSLCLYSFYQWLKSERKIWIVVYFLCYGVSFGIDIFLFFAMSVHLFLYGLNLLIKAIICKHKFETKIIHSLYMTVLPAILIILLNIVGNYFWYGTFYFSQTHELPIIKSAGINIDLIKAWMSTPFFPTFFVVLFWMGRLPEAIFTNFNNFPQAVATISGIQYATYVFYGLFIISPSIFLGSFWAFMSLTKLQKRFIYYLLIIFIIGIAINVKKLGFWAGNQYDVRYFYPYIILPAVLVGIGLKNVFSIKKIFIKLFLLLAFVLTSVFSILMGWLGEINMFMPSLSGERKIWLDFPNILTSISQYSFNQYFQATFFNSQNAWIGFTISLILSLVFLTIKYIISIYKIKRMQYYL